MAAERFFGQNGAAADLACAIGLEQSLTAASVHLGEESRHLRSEPCLHQGWHGSEERQFQNLHWLAQNRGQRVGGVGGAVVFGTAIF